MIRLIQLILFGHWHKWKVIKQAPYKTWRDEVGKGPIHAQGMQYTLQCEKCGKLKDHRS